MKKTVAMFDKRNEQKKKLEFGKSRKKDVKVGEIWWYREGVNIGSEISKDDKFLRPCMIFQSCLGNGLRKGRNTSKRFNLGYGILSEFNGRKFAIFCYSMYSTKTGKIGFTSSFPRGNDTIANWT